MAKFHGNLMTLRKASNFGGGTSALTTRSKPVSRKEESKWGIWMLSVELGSADTLRLLLAVLESLLKNEGGK